MSGWAPRSTSSSALLDLARDRGEVAAFDEPRRSSRGCVAAAGDLAQERALADPARAVDEHDLRGRVVDEERVEERQLALAADEALGVAGGEAFGEGAGHGQARLKRPMAVHFCTSVHRLLQPMGRLVGDLP